MPDLFQAVAEAIRDEWGKGRSYAELGAELGIPQRTVAAIVLGERGVGPKTFQSVIDTKPPWLWGTVLGGLLE